MFIQPSKLPARALAGMAVASFAAVGVALVAQHQFGVKPCPWCVLQRLIFLAIGTFSLLGWLVQPRRSLRQAALVVVLMLCAAGLTAAVFQHEVASQSASCAMGLADKIVTVLNLEDLWPSVFMITANCAEAAAYRFIGLPYEIWSGLLFVGMAALGLMVLNKR
ncbi:disulfide bond formation protein B [Roseateles saccharophilus]|uniref:Disulfide bond formation protein DsbB n=1 Tax=Roseateles saccharophilus TaxID=304 RepID=A0A4R3VDH5_ROSSA|nr:disulfide bond formation protein B [Roseateles saccharophilus]MDG0834792.1 disulfide bond formation protein B [Roseateles saccharophilus]TCV03387.1 disulfide bond formation protein DsbB [Roseateles saccharophilus]